jgi:hypothetical protein
MLTDTMSRPGAGASPAEEREEGFVARAIEDQTSKLPSDLFLWAGVGAILASLMLHTSNRKDDAHFIGQWVPTLLILGLYNKLVKVAGSDRRHG